MFLKNCWYVAAWDHELIDGKLLARTLLDERVVLYKGDSGQVVALIDRCCHRGAPLSLGRREGDCIRCMYHGLKFDAAGKCIQIPGQDIIPAKLGVKSYPVVERDGLVWIWMGDPALADPAEILDFPYLRDPQWKGIPGYLHYDANYMLIVDNLSDFTHLAFVHTKTLGGSEEYAYVTKPLNMERLDDGFRVERWHMSALPPPFHKKVIPAAERDQPVDRRNIGRMFVPGTFFLDTQFTPAGSGAEKGNLQGARQYRNCQFMTPETGRTTHHFWIYLNDYEGDDSNISRSLHASLIEGFLEDKHIIEAQQKAMDEDPEFKLLAVVADAPLAHFRRLMEQRIAREQAMKISPAAPASGSPARSPLPRQPEPA